MQQHAGELIRFARRFSWCADDAQDAYQRALEILVRQLRTDPPEQLLPWLRTVIRREAWSVREVRARDVAGVEVDFDREVAEGAADPAERVADFERLAHTAEALRRLKPQEVTALVLRGEGLSYRQIASRTGWTYTKVNRCVTEGRRALIGRIADIESGAECDRWLPLLSALADGEATSGQLAELRPHLRSCTACRATVRELHGAPRQVAAIVPVALLPIGAAAGARAVGLGAAAGVDAASAGTSSAEHPARLVHHVHGALHGLLERATMTATRAQSAIEALSGPKLAAVAASTAAIAGGGAAIHEVAHVGLSTHHHGKPAHVAATGPAAGGGVVGADDPAAAAIPPNTAAAGSGVVTGAPGPSGAGSSGAPGLATGGSRGPAEFGFEPAAWPFTSSARSATARAASAGEFAAGAIGSTASTRADRGATAGGEFASGSRPGAAASGSTAPASERHASSALAAHRRPTGRAAAQFGTTRSPAGGSGTPSPSSSAGGTGGSGSGSASASAPVFSPPPAQSAPPPSASVDRSAAGDPPAAEFAGP